MSHAEKRLFTAIEIPYEWRLAIRRLQDTLRREGVRARFTPEARIHLTINFIGETREEARIRDVLAGLERPVAPSLSLGSVGLFSRRKGGDLIVWEIDCDPSFLSYQKQEKKALGSLDLPMDNRRYRPHLTIAREAFGDYLKTDAFNHNQNETNAFRIKEAVLFQSLFEAGKLQYLPLLRYLFSK
ncbi:MAG: RNA 2',3'-cyclic phosphodiesterase [Eubacteriales bacterium]|nr:RNA 2',3'-cyclic phosphodiesterase [Eubacteriales bacterium]